LKFGVFLPISGRAARAVLTDAARRAEALGYDSVWAADRIVTPWEINTLYPYRRWPERIEQIERFAREATSALRGAR